MSVKFKLSEPIKFGSEMITELEFKKPKAKDLRAMPLDPKQGDFLDLAGRLCAQPDSVMNELEPSDYMKVLELVAGFISGGPAIGEKG